MDLLIEQILIYSIVFLVIIMVIIIYVRKQNRISKRVEEKIEQAKKDGLYEPISLHPVVDVSSCIKTGACITACPENDILGILNGKATTINASQCIGHGACFHACPTEAISLCIGTEKRGVELPHIDQNFETSINGLFIAGEIGGMGLIRNAVEQGKQAVENIAKSIPKKNQNDLDLLIVGAGPAGISAALSAKKHNLKFKIIEQDSLGGTVYSFPRSKIVMTSPMNLPLYGKVRLFETSKSELLDLWVKALTKNNIHIHENTKVESVSKIQDVFEVKTNKNEILKAQRVLLAIGRRGTPRKLNVKGESLPKVAYRLLEPELIKDKDVLVVGGGDSAVEAALLLAPNNKVVLSYRGEVFRRIKPKNRTYAESAIQQNILDVRFNTELINILEDEVELMSSLDNRKFKFNNDLVYIFAGGELPTQFLNKIGITITKKFGEALLKH